MYMDEILKRYISGPRCTVSQAAVILGVSHDTVCRMIKSGELIGYRPRKRNYRLYLMQVQEYAAKRQSEAIKYASLMKAEFDFSLI